MIRQCVAGRVGRCLGMLVGLAAALGVAAGVAAQTQAPAPAAGEPAAEGVDLSRKYRFSETFTTADEAKKPGEVAQHLVAFRETLSTLTDNPGGAPKSQQTVIQARYAERAAELSTLDPRQVAAAIREYQAVRITPEPPSHGGSTERPFENLLIRYEDRPNARPLVLSLRAKRTLSDAEYYLASQHLFAPSLILALPDLPVRVGDSYRVPDAGVEALVGQPVAGGRLDGRLQEIRPAATPRDRPVAMFDIVGEVQLQSEAGPVPVGIHAQILFAIEAPPVEAGADATLDAPGHITRLVLAQEMSLPVDPSRRLFQTMRRELILDRRTDPKQVGPLLAIPNYTIEPSVENSWLLYVDPKGRFRLKHPQTYRPLPGPDDSTLQLVEMHVGGPNLIALQFRPRAELDPESARKGRFESWKADGINAIPGVPNAEQLAEANWPGMRVFHFDARLVPPSQRDPGAGAVPAGDGSIYFDGYIMQTGRDLGVWAEATTPREGPEHDAFRRTAELVLRHLTFEGAAPTAGASGAGAPPGSAPAP